MKAAKLVPPLDKPICDRCTHSPAPDKDLCGEHQAALIERIKRGKK